MRTFCSSVLLLSLLLTGRAEAQSAPSAPAAAPADLTPAEIQKMFDAMVVVDAQQTLALDDQQYPAFLTRLRTLQDLRRRSQLHRTRVMGELQRLTSPRNVGRADEAGIKDRLTELRTLETDAGVELRKAYDAIDEILNVRQQGRFRVLEEQLERRKLELLMRARANRRGGR